MTNPEILAATGLREWPFRVVPDEGFCSFMADRHVLRSDIDKLLAELTIKPQSSIHLMWASYGAGKTHTLRYLEHKCRESEGAVFPVYVEFPRALKSFMDFYGAIVGRFDWDHVSQGFLECYTGDDERESFRKKVLMDCPDLLNALLMLSGGGDSAEQVLATRYLRGDSVDRKELKKIGVSHAIKDPDTGVRVLSWLFAFARSATRGTPDPARGTRFLIMLDEFQRLERTRPSVKEEINSCLQLLFNSNPLGLSFVISFTGEPAQKGFPDWLAPDLVDRMGISRVLTLPPLTTEDAKLFVAELLDRFRVPSQQQDRFHPFTEKTVEMVLLKMSQHHEDFRPRRLMTYFDQVLLQALPAIASGESDAVTPSHVESALRDRILGQVDSGE